MSTTQSHVPDTHSETYTIHAVDDNEYYAGMIDAQLQVGLAKNNQIRVVLTSNEPRVAEQMSARFRPTRITIVKRPGKKDVCTILFVGEQSVPLLLFAAEHCKIRKTLAQTALDFLNNKATVDSVKDVPLNEVDCVSLDYASGMFDVRSIVTQTVPATETTKKKRGNVKVVVPKSEQFIIPALQRVLHGRVKKASPCRLVYESRDTIGTLKNTVEHHIRAKKEDLMSL